MLLSNDADGRKRGSRNGKVQVDSPVEGLAFLAQFHQQWREPLNVAPR